MLRSVTVAAVVLGLVVAANGSTVAKESDLAWHTSYADAYKIAQAENKPVLVYLWTANRYRGERAVLGGAEPEIHPLSHEYTREMFDSKKVVEESRRFVCVSVCVDTPDEFSQRCLQHRAQVVITDPMGNVLETFKGRRDPGTGFHDTIFRPEHLLKVMRAIKWPASDGAPK